MATDVQSIGVLPDAGTRENVLQQLTEEAIRLARLTESLDDFAGLVAHDVRSALIMALRDEDPRAGLTRSLGIVDSILDAVRADTATSGPTQVADCVQHAISDLGDAGAGIVVCASGEFPMPPDALRLVVRNLLANAVAAGATQIHVSALARGSQRMLAVDDDGVGIGAADLYATGAQLGLRMCRRLIERCGGALELRPRATGGTRAVIMTAKAGA